MDSGFPSKAIKVFEDWTSQTVEYVVKEEQERHKDCSYARIVEVNANRNAAFNIAYRALGYISKVGVTVNTLKIFPIVDRNAMM